MDEEFRQVLETAINAAPDPAGVNWPMALAVGILRELEARCPGFRDAVRDRLLKSAHTMADSENAADRRDAPSLQELAESWVFDG